MIDDERLQELLSRASSLYNDGEYQGAIEAWKEALGVDPQSQKAREGIRMATLLLGDVEAAPAAGPSPEGAATADGVEAVTEMPVEEAEAQLELGIAQVKQLMAERRFSEAIEGAQGLLPLAPDSAELLGLLEEAQHSFESTPFIEEHLTLARELLNQERFAEAETECKKIFTLDAGHPGGKTLLKEIRDKIQENLKAAASQLGGMTVKLTMPQALAAGARPKPPEPKPAAPQARPVQPPVQAPAEIPEVYAGPGPDDEATSPSGASFEEPPPESGDQAKLQEEVSARATLEAAFADQAFAGGTAEESPFELNDMGVRSPAPAAQTTAPTPHAAEPEKETVVEAKTVRPPTSRVVPKAVTPETVPAPPAAVAHPASSSPAAVSPPPVVAGPARKAPATHAEPPATVAAAVKPATVAGKAGAPAVPASKGLTPAPPAPAAQPAKAAAIPVADLKGHDETAAWETELAQLNLKDKERGLLRGTGAKVTAAAVDQTEVDLMSLLDTGGMPGAPGGGAEAPAAHPPSVPLAHAREAGKTPETGAETARSKQHAPGAVQTAAPDELPHTEPRPRPSGRPRAVVPVPKHGSSFMKYLLLLLLLAGGGGAAWVFYIQPRILGGAGQPGQPVVPPAGSPGGAVDGSHGPIPTPIGGTSRQQAGSPQPNGGAPASAVPRPAGEAAMAASGPGAGGTAQTPAGGAPGTAAGQQGPAGAPAASPAQTGGKPAAAGAEHAPEPIKPPSPPPLSPEEAKRRIASFTADGKRLMGLGKWREARAKLQAVLALDPANIEVKDLADKAQAKIDDEQQLQDEFDSVKKLYADKDYENALRKLYRLPRDRGLGDIDRYIRNAWYDWAVVLLKAGNARDALQKLSEALTVDPDDAAALKLQEVAEKYNNRAKDRVFYAFTDSLALRGFDQK